MTNSIQDILKTDLLFVTGSNTTENHPVIGSVMLQARQRGAKLIVADPRQIPLSRFADLYLPIRPGSNVALLNAMMHVILAEGLEAREYITARTEGIDALAALVADCTPEAAADICGVPAEAIRQAARMYAQAPQAGIYYAMGITQHSDGTNHVKAIADLAMLCGNVGLEHGGVNPLRGQNNVQGACDMGGLPDVFPGYRKVFDDDARRAFEAAWETPLPDKPGLTLPKMMNAAAEGRLKCLYIMGENPMVSDPDLAHISHALDSLDFLVVQDIFLTETAQKAHVVLPAACFAEKEGTFTNTERRVQRVRQAVQAPGQALPDLEILLQLADRLGARWSCRTPEAVMAEIAAVTPAYGGIRYSRLETGGLQWPCPTPDHPGTPVLHVGRFTRGPGVFFPVPHKGPAETPDAAYPLVLTTGRVLYHYHTRTMTGRVEGLNTLSGHSYVEISPQDAATLGIADGQPVQVASRRGAIEVPARVTPRIREGVVFIPFHFAEGAANHLTHAALDPVTDIPELKVCAVRLRPLEVV